MATSGSKSVSVTSWDTLTFSWWFNSDDQSVANNTTLVRWKLELISGSSGRIDSTASKDWSVTVNGTKYSGTNTIGIANNSTKKLASGTTTVKHNDDGTKTFSFSFSQEIAITFSGTYIGTKSGSGSGTLTTIPRKSTLSVGNGTLGTAQTIKISRNSSTFKHTLKAKCGSDSERTFFANTTSTSLSWTPLISWASQNKTGTSVSVKLTLITIQSDGTEIGSVSETITCSIPTSYKNSAGNTVYISPSVSLAVSDSMGYADKYGAYVQGQSKLNIVATPSTANCYGATIKSYKTTADGKTYTKADVTTGVISGKGTLAINTTVTDSRGRTAKDSESVSVLEYAFPKITALNVTRRDYDANGENYAKSGYLAVSFGAEITPLNNKNSAVYSVKYKKATESEDKYVPKTLTDYAGEYAISGGLFVFPADPASSYNIVLSVEDDFRPSTKTATGASEKHVWSMLKKLGEIVGLAIGKIAELEGVFDIALQTRFTGGILHPVLEPETDLDDVLTPNTYVGANVSTNNYVNCPIDSGTFTLEVVGMGEEGQRKQRLTYCHKTASRVLERIYYASSWGEWVCVSDYGGQLLWDGRTLDSGGYYMTEGHTATLSQNISKQPTGVVLVFRGYWEGAAKDYWFVEHFVPKKVVSLHSGKGHCFHLVSNAVFEYVGAKYLYIYDDRIVGEKNNKSTGTSNGVTYDNSKWVLSYIIGV